MRKFFILTLLIFLSTFIFSQSWKHYPYNPPGTDITFPGDEAFHLKDDMTPYLNEYWYSWFDFYTDSGKHIPVIFCVFNGFSFFMTALDTDTSKYYYFENTATVNSMDCVSFDHLKIDTNELKLMTKTDSSGNLIPFEYTAYLDFDGANLSIDMNCVKRPLMDGGDGYLPLGVNQYAHYYSETGMVASGYLTLNGNTYHVSGNGWMEHVYGDFVFNFSYEWWCIKLNNGVDLCLWTIFDSSNRINYGDEGFTLMSGYIDENNSFHTVNFKVDRMRYFLDDFGQIVAYDWHLSCDNPKISLDLKGFGNLSQMTDSGIWEEYGSVSGKFSDEDVSGCFVSEHTHNYEEPEIEISSPDNNDTLSLPVKLKYEVENWDDGFNLKYKILISYDGNNFKEIDRDIDGFSYGLVPDEVRNSFYVKVAAYSPHQVLYDESLPIFISLDGNYLTDFNGDGLVDSRDLGILLSNFGSTLENFDLNGDGVVDGDDVDVFKRVIFYIFESNKMDFTKRDLLLSVK